MSTRPDERRRTFDAVPQGSASTWWGHAWVRALEELSLDDGRLARGRTYAREGYVDTISVTPGRIVAYVRGSRARPYRTEIRLRTLTDGDWESFLDTAAAHPAHLAALLDKDMPHTLAELSADAGVELLPAVGDLLPACTCPDRGRPCKHAAALCYRTARLLDEDPFVLLLMRGRGERELLDALSRRNAAHAARERTTAPATPGIPAREAVARAPLPPLPAPLPVPPHPAHPPSYPAAAGAPDALALDQLATDAAVRAHTILSTSHDPVADLTPWQDAVRLAAAQPGSGLAAPTRALYRDLATATGRTPTALARAVAAWRQGGPDALEVLETPWDPPAGPFDRARPALAASGLANLRPWRNHLTAPGGSLQLRLGRDGYWYAYESDPGRDDWWPRPRGTPSTDPVEAVARRAS
ncbi:SWIM zinc finger family protein [Streptomyces sp. NPDC051219]|uniref:SWIM zinc finger family protein n=1 Tax=Streptomyces sp. NPDC051219 TaxID=3155283 RepID=UPI003444DD5E